MTKRKRKPEIGSMLRKPPKHGYVESLSIAISDRMRPPRSSSRKKKRKSEGEQYMEQLERHV